MSEPYGFLTNKGRQLEAAALANGTALNVAEIAWGTGARAITGGEISLENETGRAPVIASGIHPDNSSVAFFRHDFAAQDGPYIISEAGLFDAAGNMLAIVTYPVPMPKPLNFALTFDIMVAFSDLENLNINVLTPGSLVPEERRIDTGSGLVGGGDLSGNLNLSLDPGALQSMDDAEHLAMIAGA
ncbi:phage tail protein [Phaeobacter sp. JH209B]|uniref:phage tail protein n=1 Tax=Phaeobacter TaxID=302485 RepID=UPI0021A750B7|nr:phage tail protein [Phaeobacter inhibens]UWR66899.1 phage tail protein [Phaeobacter inhibens]